MKAFITGLASTEIDAWEREFLAREQPAGLILFARNIDSPDQVRGLIDSALAALGDRDRLVLVDQEGGRVRRLKPPAWPAYPPAGAIGALHQHDPDKALRAAYLSGRLIASDLHPLGFSVDCLPILDCRFHGASDVVGDRAYSSDPEVVAALGEAACQGLIDGGILPTIKHMPGHGRAMVDSHLALPTVDRPIAELDEHDFLPFKQLRDHLIGMTAHIVFPAIDPNVPATQSPKVIEDVVRGRIGFQGLLLTDDISMKALGGPMAERCRLALRAGCDLVLHCNGERTEMTAVAEGTAELTGASLERYRRAISGRRIPTDADIPTLRSEFHDLLDVFWRPAG